MSRAQEPATLPKSASPPETADTREPAGTREPARTQKLAGAREPAALPDQVPAARWTPPGVQEQARRTPAGVQEQARRTSAGVQERAARRTPPGLREQARRKPADVQERAPRQEPAARRKPEPAGRREPEPAVRQEPADLREPTALLGQEPAALLEQEPAALRETPEPPAAITKRAVPALPLLPVTPYDDTQQFPAISPVEGSGSGTPVLNVISALPGRDYTSATPERAAGPSPAAVPAHRDPPAARRHRMRGVLILVGVLLATGSVAVALYRHMSAGSHRAQASAMQAVRDMQSIRNTAASWVASQVSARAVVSCDPLMCAALRAHGIPAARLLRLSSASADPLRSQVVVATEVVRSQFGRRLGSVYAPVVIASFGTGQLRVDIRAIAPHGAAAYRSALSADVRARKDSGATLLRSQRITASAAARAQLAEGRADWRLLVTIAELAAMHPVSILAFGDSGPGAGPAMPLRSVDLAEAAGGAATPSPAQARSMVNFLRAQHGTYVPAHIQTVRLAGDVTALRIEFAAPSPVDLLSPLSSGIP